MASQGDQGLVGQFACHCLNIRIRRRSVNDGHPQHVPNSPKFAPVYVGEDGVSIVHPQLTIRSKTRGDEAREQETSRSSRYTLLHCLICHTVVYRVCQPSLSSVEGKEGPVLPTDDWVEQETLKSPDGWIEVSKDCLADNQVEQLQSSPRYSSPFSVVFPEDAEATPVPRERIPSPTQSDTPRTYLSHLKPILPPPPFTPSHPVFLHLAETASTESKKIRSEAESDISHIVQQKIAEIELLEGSMRRNVEALWRSYHNGLSKLQISVGAPEKKKAHRHSLSASEKKPPSNALAVKDFVPQAVSANSSQRPSTSSARRPSGVSASLATTSFHHPKANQESPPRDTYIFAPSRSVGAPSGDKDDQPTVLKYRPTTDNALNTSVSHRYFQIEEEMDKRRQELARQEAERSSKLTRTSTSAQDNKETTKDEPPRNQATDSTSTEAQSAASASKDPTSPRSAKGKRTVTFKSEPAVVTITRELDSEKEAAAQLANQDFGELVFDLEEDETSGSSTQREPAPVLPLTESVPHVRRKQRPSKNSTSAYHVFGPSSLPNLTRMRPARPENTNGATMNTRSTNPSPLRQPPTTESNGVDENNSHTNGVKQLGDEEEIFDPQEQDILRLVAADTPSHRGRWKKDSQAWKDLVKRQEYSGLDMPRARMADEDDFDEDYDDFAPYHYAESSSRGLGGNDEPYVGSVPINIRPMRSHKPTLTLASYREESSLADHPTSSSLPSTTPSGSSRSIRKAAYAKRDQAREMDPGPLDYAEDVDEDGVDDDSDDDNAEINGHGKSSTTPGSRGAKHALKILKARSQIPEAGMWRSLV